MDERNTSQAKKSIRVSQIDSEYSKGSKHSKDDQNEIYETADYQ